ncbi:ABC transporter permease [Streptococcus dentiloxodontae]
MLKLFKIEARKYRGLPVFRLLFVSLVISLFFASLQIFDHKNAADLANRVIFYQVWDAVAMIKVIVQPVILASLVSMAVQLENRHKMWKILTSSGVNYKSIYAVKFCYIYGAYALMQIIEFLTIAVLIKMKGYTASIPIGRMVLYYLTLLAISGVIMLIHYLLSLKWANQLISLSVAVLASLMSVIMIFISKVVMYIIPYTWYAFLMASQPERVGDKYIYHIMAFQPYPLIASIILGFVLYQVGKRVKIGD